jgi:hypothetical protein
MASFLFFMISLAAIVIVLWTAGAIYYDVIGASTLGLLALATWMAGWGVALVWWRPIEQPFAVLVIALIGIFLWWRTLRPSQQRDWNPHFTRLAVVNLNGDDVSIENVRNSTYAGLGESSPRYEDRSYRLSELRGIDVLMLTWGSRWMSHPMFVFDFGGDGRVCISIEVRYRAGQRFSFFPTLYRQQELIYTVSDERDAILRRTKFLSNHDMYLYRVNADGLAVREFFLSYAVAINSLAKEPQWYHGLTTNCTTRAYTLARSHIRWSWRMLLNGSLDKLLYERGLLDQSQPFEQLKRSSWINDIANRAPEVGFGDYLRQHLPGYRRADVDV